MKQLLITSFLGIIFLLACSQKHSLQSNLKQREELIYLDGIVKYCFYRDQNIRPDYVSNDFWVEGYYYTNEDWVDIDLLPSYYHIKKMETTCQEDILTKFNVHEDSLRLGTDFLTTVEDKVFSDYLFYEDDNHLFVAFHFSGKGLLIDKICPSFLDYMNRDTSYCPLPAEAISIPMIQLISVSNQRALTKDEIDQYNFTYYPHKSFKRNWCE